mmetsp:Transcript_79875/g.201016  ORF Transcript_79875/g.201016 Transcript_79875/m.201016 type:complete len:204 (-) Transcript_79875:131-742(-)
MRPSATEPICTASSRVGARTRTSGPSAGRSLTFWPAAWTRAGTKNARVFPEPVGAIPTTSCPASARGKTFFWIGFMPSKPPRLKPSASHAGNTAPKSPKRWTASALSGVRQVLALCGPRQAPSSAASRWPTPEPCPPRGDALAETVAPACRKSLRISAGFLSRARRCARASSSWRKVAAKTDRARGDKARIAKKVAPSRRRRT